MCTVALPSSWCLSRSLACRRLDSRGSGRRWCHCWARRSCRQGGISDRQDNADSDSGADPVELVPAARPDRHRDSRARRETDVASEAHRPRGGGEGLSRCGRHNDCPIGRHEQAQAGACQSQAERDIGKAPGRTSQVAPAGGPPRQATSRRWRFAETQSDQTGPRRWARSAPSSAARRAGPDRSSRRRRPRTAAGRTALGSTRIQ
jgi:hypothetical protein